MGGAVSSGRDNNELVDNLMGGGYIRTRNVERVFRVLDRADYMTPTERDQAYKDLAWRSGALHLSAPCIYSEVMEALELKPGLSFLNLGSGTGYLSTLVGLAIGSAGISHGVELHPRVVEYSTKKLNQFQENSITLDEFDFCVPKYYSGNALCLAPLQSQYDRVYVGAGVLPKYENYFKQLIKVSGVLVMPLGDTLVQMQRVSETAWSSRQLLNVSFALLRAPTKEESAEPIKLDELMPVPLTVLCRASVRRAMLGGVCRRHPELQEPAESHPPAPRPRPRPRRICIPLDPDTDDPSLNELHDMEGPDGGHEMNALLSLVLSMGNNRVAGSLRFGEERDRPSGDEELEVLIDGIGHASDSSSSESDYSTGTWSETVGAQYSAPTERSSEPTERSSEPTERSSKPTERSSEPTERSSEPTERSSEPTERSSEPTEGPSVSTERPSEPTAPSSEPTAPSSEPIAQTSEPAARPSAAGAANLHPAVSEGVFSRRRACPTGAGTGTRSDGRGAAPAAGEAAPGATASGTDLSALNPAGRVEVDDEEVLVMPKPTAAPDLPATADCSSSDDSKPSKSGKSPGAARATKDAPEIPPAEPSSGPSDGPSSGPSGSGGSGPTGGIKRGSDGSDGGGARPRRRCRALPPAPATASAPAPAPAPAPARGSTRCRFDASLRSKRFPPEVQIYFGNDAGVYAGSDEVQQETEEPEAVGSEDVNMDADTSGDDEPKNSSKDKKRQKLDSGIGEGTASSSAGSTPASHSPEESDGRPPAEISPVDNQNSGVRRRAPPAGAGAAAGEGAGVRAGAGAGAGARARARAGARGGRARRTRRSGRDTRRMRLSVIMKRAIKELPLPYALKRYVNLQRCFQF